MEGAEAGAFDGKRDRVFVPPSSTLAVPGSVRAELTVNLEELDMRRTLIEGYLSFALYVESTGAVGGAILRYDDWYGLRSDPGLVQPGRWILVELLYVADTHLSLSLDGIAVAAAVRPVGEANGVAWPFGLNIGAWPDADQRMLRGRIEEVRLWRTRSDRW